MMIKNSGFIPGAVPNPYPAKKIEHPTNTSDQSNAVKLNKISAPAAKLDTIEISRNPADSRPSLSQVRDGIIKDLNQDKDVSFLDTLKTQIKSNQYPIDSKELSRIMLTGTKE
jgi:hypothetical protein